MAFFPTLFGGGLIVMVFTIFKDVRWGVYLLVSLIPQPNIWYKFHEYFLGHDFLDFATIAIFLGIIIQKRGFEFKKSSILIIIFLLYSLFSISISTAKFSLPIDFSGGNRLIFAWKNYAQMILLYFLVSNSVKEEKDCRNIVLIITSVFLIIALRSYRSYSAGESFHDESRVGGPFETVGLGSNHLGAFISYCGTLILGLFLSGKGKAKRMFYFLTFIIGLHPLFFSYSRGAYLGSLLAVGFLGVIRKNLIIICMVVVVLISWEAVLPSSVVDRIKMTKTEDGQYEDSAAGRLMVWDQAMEIFSRNPLVGVGYGGFGFMVPEGQTLTDTHNYYAKTLCEGGIIGFSLLLAILFRAFLSGKRLWDMAKTPIFSGIGLGFMGCVIALAVANFFGDRFSYFVLGGYFWIMWGLVDKGIMILENDLKRNEGYDKANRSQIGDE
jgi:putative inorganic carbon (hco3(-)) transporter